MKTKKNAVNNCVNVSNITKCESVIFLLIFLCKSTVKSYDFLHLVGLCVILRWHWLMNMELKSSYSTCGF